MKKYAYLSLSLIPSSLWAEATQPYVSSVVISKEIVSKPSSGNTILPQLSFAAQQARAIELAKQAEHLLQLEQQKRLSVEQLQQAEQTIQQAIGDSRLLLHKATTKVYVESDFNLLWKDKNAEKLFLKEYIAFAVSGVSKTATTNLQKILTSEGLARDIFLTDSFLDYLYYSHNVETFANDWLYSLGSYKTKAPEELVVNSWVNAAKLGQAAQFIADLTPRNHIYQETIDKLFELSPHESLAVESIKESKNKKSAKGISSVSFYKLALNAQRLRVIPSFHNGIFVNIPSYQLYYVRDGQLLLQSKVIVGRNDRRTPVMTSKLSNVVVNPPWNVPTSIKNKDLIPKMRLDPSYVERNGYEIIDRSGKRVSPDAIDWESAGNNFPYRLRQKAGDNSALGRYKFNMPSSDAIYLHDTPNRGLFGRSNRALSSGCVRVAKSDELATLLLKEAGWSDQRKKNVLASKKTTSAQIQSDNPVYLYYVTAWIENGQVYTLPDIYRVDGKIPATQLDWDQMKSLI